MIMILENIADDMANSIIYHSIGGVDCCYHDSNLSVSLLYKEASQSWCELRIALLFCCHGEMSTSRMIEQSLIVI